jgi:hypothetical protein
MVTTRDAVSELISRYFRGIFEGDTELLGRAFHPRAVLFSVVAGVSSERTLDDYLAVVAGRSSARATR